MTVRLLHQEDPYLAVIVKVRASKKEANLYLYSPQGILIYHEALHVYDPALAAVDLENGAEALLVGGDNIVWKYTADYVSRTTQPEQ